MTNNNCHTCGHNSGGCWNSWGNCRIHPDQQACIDDCEDYVERKFKNGKAIVPSNNNETGE